MSKNIKACLSHKTDDWKTPLKIYSSFMKKGFIDCFPYCSTFDQMERQYTMKRLFINPPFSKLDKVVDWVVQQAKNHNEIVLLIPCRTDTQYFKRLCSEICWSIFFIEGRLHFNDSEFGAPFPCMFLHIDSRDLVCNIFATYQCISVDRFLKRFKKESKDEYHFFTDFDTVYE